MSLFVVCQSTLWGGEGHQDGVQVGGGVGVCGEDWLSPCLCCESPNSNTICWGLGNCICSLDTQLLLTEKNDCPAHLKPSVQVLSLLLFHVFIYFKVKLCLHCTDATATASVDARDSL